MYIRSIYETKISIIPTQFEPDSILYMCNMAAHEYRPLLSHCHIQRTIHKYSKIKVSDKTLAYKSMR